MRTASRLASIGILALLGACGDDAERGAGSPTEGSGAADAASGIVLRDVRESSGITWQHHFIDAETGSTYKLNPYDHGSGVLVGDVNADDIDDVLFLQFLGSNALYAGQGDGTFRDVTAQAGVALPRAITVGGCFGDVDNDGDQDLYLTTYRQGNHLFHNAGDGTFTDVTEEAGVAYVGFSNSATFLDYDLDGDLDLYLANIGKFTTDTIDEQLGFYLGQALEFDLLSLDTTTPAEGESNHLWRNRGDGTFEDATDEAGVGSGSWNGDATVADYDADGDLDLYVTNMFGANNLFRNEGDGRFTDVAADALGMTSWGAIGCRFFDADNDGLQDLVVVDMHSDMWTEPFNLNGLEGLDPAAKYQTPAGGFAPGRIGRSIAGNPDVLRSKGSPVLFGNTFFRNLGAGKFEERSDAAGLETFWPWGIAVADFDRDGYQDLFFASGMSYPYPYWPNALMHNQGDLTFRDVTAEAGVDPPPGGTRLDLEIRDFPFYKSSRTAVVLDFDLDGDLDLIVNNFNDHPYVYANESTARTWVAVRLIGNGKDTTRDAYGSLVTVEAGGQTHVRTVEGAAGYLAQSTRTAYFGLGDTDAIDKVTVRWAGGQSQDVTAAVPINQLTVLRQE